MDKSILSNDIEVLIFLLKSSKLYVKTEERII